MTHLFSAFLRVSSAPSALKTLMTHPHSIWQTDRIRLRAVEPSDAEIFQQWSADDEVARLCYEIPFPRSMARTKKHVEALTQAEPEHDSYRWIIENHEGAAVGNINTHDCARRHGTFSFGLAIEREHWRHGYASDAIRLVLRYFFRELGYQKVNSGVYEFNEASIRLHERLGFQHEGRIRRMIYTNGRYWDHILFGLTREEFEQADG